ncbi:hypothetical protein [Montanilutibacter psychrotolerans]|uniref:Uncharacterized protein n=1 Tax=Montanilutibacter psychrotolerans TaxID=1327343 RepID=A0A3M8SZ84_9GAMM|nr:hypothetical protein [Lysobacter psychrotolerans]RNF86015.1 hypothetical protein EER27_00845 [Lysobacter psychrotolerans]
MKYRSPHAMALCLAFAPMLAAGAPVGASALASDAPSSAAASTTAAPAGETVAKMPFLGGFLRESRIVYPLEIDGWTAIGEHLYDDQQYGVSVRYADGKREDRWIDVFFYPAGVLDEEDFGEAARNEVEILRLSARPGGYDSVELGELQRLALPVRERNRSSEAKPGDVYYSLDMEHRREGRTMSSAMVLLLDRLYFVKGRFSVDVGKGSRRHARERLERFMVELRAATSIASTGDCWMPLPIEQLPPDAPAPADAAMASESGGVRSYLVRDRVVSTVVDDPQAELLMMAGMTMRNRIFPGCEPAEGLNPLVPEGKREIRLEYRALEAVEPGSVRPLRTRKAGLG